MSEMQLEKNPTNGAAKAPLQNVAWRVTPELDLYESGSEYLIVLDVPGASTESVNVQVVGTRVFVRAEQAAPAASGPAASGPAASSPAGANPEGNEPRQVAVVAFERELELPVDVDPNSASAVLQNGVLEIRLAKSAASRRVKIPVNAN